MSGRRQASLFALWSARGIFPVPATLTPLTAGPIFPTRDINTNNTGLVRTYLRMLILVDSIIFISFLYSTSQNLHVNGFSDPHSCHIHYSKIILCGLTYSLY